MRGAYLGGIFLAVFGVAEMLALIPMIVAGQVRVIPMLGHRFEAEAWNWPPSLMRQHGVIEARHDRHVFFFVMLGHWWCCHARHAQLLGLELSKGIT